MALLSNKDYRYTKKQKNLSIVVTALIMSLILPPETSVMLGSIRLSPFRVVLLLFIIPCIASIIINPKFKFGVIDLLILCHSSWVIIALCVYSGTGQGLESGGIYFIEAVGAYFVARKYITNAPQMQKFVKLLFTTILVLLIFTIPETITGTHYIRDIFRSILGGSSIPYMDKRLGLSRALGSFEHPIIYGIFCSSAAGIYFYGKNKINLGKSFIPMSLISLAAMISLSTGAIVSLFIQIGLIVWANITRGVKGRWLILLSAFISIFCIISIVSNRSPLKVFLSYLSFSAHTGYNRIRIFDYGMVEISNHPLFGIGLGEWDKAEWMVSNSMDNFWLATAVRYGIPAFIFLASALIILILKINHRKNKKSIIGHCYLGWCITMVGMIIAGCTVHFWNAQFVYFNFLLGAGAWMADSKLLRTK